MLALKPVNNLTTTTAYTQPTPSYNIWQTRGEKKNIYVCFLHGLQEIFNHTRGQVAVSMNDYPVNEISTSQK